MPDEASGSHRVARVLGVSAVLVFAAIFLAPMLKTGYISDDVVSSLMPGMTKFTGQSVVSRTLSHMRSSMLEGRFYPLVWLQYYAVFFSLQNVLLYKSFILAMVLLDLLLFVVFVRMSARDDGLALLAATLTVPLFQFRAFFDPILAFHGLLQFIVAGILLSLLSLQRFLEGRGRVWLVLSVMTFLACCLAYEVCYPLVFLYVPSIASGCRDWRSRWTTFRPYLTAVGACVTLSILMRWLHPSPSYIHGVSHDPSAIVVAMATQTSSALPLSYFLADPAGLFTDAHGFSAILRWMARPDAGIVTALASLVVGICLRSRPAALAETVPAVPSGRLGVLPQVGLLLAVLPAVMIAISSRYQAQIRFGKGYLPVYVQYFGVGLLLAWLIRSALDRLASRVALTRVARVALTVVVGITTCLTYRANCTTAVGLVSPPGSRTFNQEAAWNDGIWHDRRNNLEAALHAGLLDDVPEHSQVILENEYPGWHDSPFSLFFYAMHASRVLATIPPSARTPTSPNFASHASSLAQIPGKSASRYWLRDVSLGKTDGYVIIAPLDNDPRTGEPPRSRGFRLYVRQRRRDRTGLHPAFLVVGRLDEPLLIRSDRDLVEERSGPDWTIYSLRPGAVGLDPSTITLRFNDRERERLASQRK